MQHAVSQQIQRAEDSYTSTISPNSCLRPQSPFEIMSCPQEKGPGEQKQWFAGLHPKICYRIDKEGLVPLLKAILKVCRVMKRTPMCWSVGGTMTEPTH